jgi:hypothetical protein
LKTAVVKKERPPRPTPGPDKPTPGPGPAPEDKKEPEKKEQEKKVDPYAFSVGEAVTYESVNTKFIAVLTLRGKRTATAERLILYLQGLRQTAADNGLGIGIDLKLLLSVITVHFDQKNTDNKALAAALSPNQPAFMPIPVWHA